MNLRVALRALFAPGSFSGFGRLWFLFRFKERVARCIGLAFRTLWMNTRQGIGLLAADRTNLAQWLTNDGSGLLVIHVVTGMFNCVGAMLRLLLIIVKGHLPLGYRQSNSCQNPVSLARQSQWPAPQLVGIGRIHPHSHQGSFAELREKPVGMSSRDRGCHSREMLPKRAV